MSVIVHMKMKLPYHITGLNLALFSLEFM